MSLLPVVVIAPILLKTPSQALRRHPRSSHGVRGLPIRACSCAVFGEWRSWGTITGPALSPFPLGQGEIPGLPQCVPEPIYVILGERPFLALITWLLGVGDGGSKNTDLSSLRFPSKLAMEGLVASDQVVLRGP